MSAYYADPFLVRMIIRDRLLQAERDHLADLARGPRPSIRAMLAHVLRTAAARLDDQRQPSLAPAR
jgi:hypothetical protein